MFPLAGMRTNRKKDTHMRRLLMHAALAVTAAAMISPALAQSPPSTAAAPQWPPPQVAAVPPWYPGTYSGNPYYPFPLLAPTPEDAYRDGTINRWELEQLVGPLPQALQGPPVDGNRGGDGGDGRGS